ncbi:calcipressin-1-like [Paramacrobiotus metropolitanus]|uniref:calcipressin-1-like n=1 Tax=Paramacrobiotus metropolitanus TaxID=2943436 RepID=UPI002445CA3F|nr:calcipressin-1-like [Paramacrobiotus metropolitanus]
MVMAGTESTLDEMMENARISKGTKRKELSKQGSTGSMDSDISEDSSASSNSWSGDSGDPTSQLLVAHMDPAIFCDRDLMDLFENEIRKYDPEAKIYYFKNFCRARIDMDSVATACVAKQELHDRHFGSRTLKCYYFRDLLLGRRNSDHLELPPLDKQFLISPPASPPVGWEPVHEGEPIIDYDLLAALASLQPGESHELHPGAQERNIPAIILQPCDEIEDDLKTASFSPMDLSDEDDDDGENQPVHQKKFKPRITQTRRPPLQ